MVKLVAILSVLALFPATVALGSTPSDSQSQVQVHGILRSAGYYVHELADDYFHAGDYPRLITTERLAVTVDPDLIEAYNDGAWIMWSSGLDKDAEAFYALAIRENPHRSGAYYDCGFYYYNHKRDYKTALAIMKKDVACSDSDVTDWKMLAHTYERLNEPDQSLAVWKVIAKRWPNGPAVQVNLHREMAVVAAEQQGSSAASGTKVTPQ